MTEKRTLSEADRQQITEWARDPKTLAQLKASELFAKQVNEELERARRIDPRSLREPMY